MAKKPIPIKTVGVRRKIAVSGAVNDIGLTDKDCICATMAPHCPVHSRHKNEAPKPGQDCIR